MNVAKEKSCSSTWLVNMVLIHDCCDLWPQFLKLYFIICFKVRVTDILGGGRFYIQSVEDARVGAIQQSLEGLRLKDMHMLPSSFQPAKGDTVIAQFTGDDSWNRALVSLWVPCPIWMNKRNVCCKGFRGLLFSMGLFAVFFCFPFSTIALVELEHRYWDIFW